MNADRQLYNAEKPHHSARWPLLVFIVCIMPLAACDGGLFGTGDDSDTLITDAGSMPQGSDNLPAESVGSNTGDHQTSDGNSDNTDTTGPLIMRFSNTEPSGLATSNNAMPALKLINLSARTVQTRIDAEAPGTTDETSDSSATQPGHHTVYKLGTGNNRVTVTDEAGRSVLVISPLDTGADSYTTLIVADMSSLQQDAQDTSVIAALLPTRAISSSPDTADVRLIDLNSMSNSSTQAPYILQPDGDNPAAAEIALSPVNTAGTSVSDYQSATTGDYLLTQHMSNDTPTELTLSAGVAYTVIIQDHLLPIVHVFTDNIDVNP